MKDKDKVINQLLERIANLEREVERLNNIIDKLEFNLKLNIEDLEENGFSEARIDEDKEILRFIEYLKVSDKE